MKHIFHKQILYTFLLLLAVISCKKIDLEKIPKINTSEAENITADQCVVGFEIIDPGENTPTRAGICFSSVHTSPTIDNASKNGINVHENDFNIVKKLALHSLLPQMKYYARSYLITPQYNQPVYGETVVFTTESSGSVNQYIHYDNGINENAVGIDGGGIFEAAIRFYNADLPSGELTVTKMRFYFDGNSNTEYYISIYTIENGITYLQYDQFISNPQNQAYAEYILDIPFIIPQTGIEGLYFGYFVIDYDGIYPGGTDAGPYDPSGNGDLILLDGSTQWERLEHYGIGGNWNIQVYVTNSKGEEFEITRKELRKNNKIIEEASNVYQKAMDKRSDIKLTSHH